MTVDLNSVHVNHNDAAQRFEAQVEGHTAGVDYYRSGDNLVFLHTEVPTPLRGQGIGEKIIETALAYARDHALTVTPKCGFVAAFIRRHGEHRDLLSPAYSE